MISLMIRCAEAQLMQKINKMIFLFMKYLRNRHLKIL